jgi:hypothetical protein
MYAGTDAGKGLYREAMIYGATTIYESTLRLPSISSIPS